MRQHTLEVIMNPIKNIISTSLICTMLVTGCGTDAAKQHTQTPEEAIHVAFTALKELDMDTFNACTNNRKGDKYRIFSDLLKEKSQPYMPLAEALVANLSWEINSIEESGDTATANVTIGNKDFSDALGNYVADMICYVEEQYSLGADLQVLIGDIVEKARTNPEFLVPYLEACQQDFYTDAVITLERVDNTWQIQLDDSLCDSLIGYAGFDSFSEDIEPLLQTAEEFLQNNLKRWGIDLEENAGKWLNQLGKAVDQFLH